MFRISLLDGSGKWQEGTVPDVATLRKALLPYADHRPFIIVTTEDDSAPVTIVPPAPPPPPPPPPVVMAPVPVPVEAKPAAPVPAPASNVIPPAALPGFAFAPDA
jgi:hypothetical protein